MTPHLPNQKIGIVIPCFKVKSQILDVLAKIDSHATHIYVVDDACPEQSGEFVKSNTNDPRVQVLVKPLNGGVGSAMVTGYQQALKDQCDIIVKLDGDGQMDPQLISALIEPILRGDADYSKGNRFYYLSSLSSMPPVRIFGNAALSFISKFSSGYWDIMDPTNGFIAIRGSYLKKIPLEKLSSRYFFESDMLFRLNITGARVVDCPMDALYGDEKSNLRISKVLFSFPFLYLNRMLKRMVYTYFLRDFNVGSLNLLAAVTLLPFGLIFGAYNWIQGVSSHSLTPLGTIMLSAVSIIVGFQALLSFVSYDMMNSPNFTKKKIYFLNRQT